MYSGTKREETVTKKFSLLLPDQSMMFMSGKNFLYYYSTNLKMGRKKNWGEFLRYRIKKKKGKIEQIGCMWGRSTTWKR